MLRLGFALAMGGASTACALAAVGWVVYARHPEVGSAVLCFAGWGFLAGLACGALHLHFHGRPTPAPAALPPEALAQLVRSAQARALAERQARSGSAADRRVPDNGPDAPAAQPPATPVTADAVAEVATP